MTQASNSGGFVRFATTTLLIGGLGYGGGWVYANFFGTNTQLIRAQQDLHLVRSELDQVQQRAANQAMMIDQMGDDLATKQEEIARLDTSMRLLKTNHRIAVVEVLAQDQDPQSGAVWTEFQFQEVDQGGQAITEPRVFRVDGDLVYFDYWVVKFDDALVEQADPDRAASLFLFRRLFSEFQQPHEGYPMDSIGARPAAYGAGPVNEYEQRIWSKFWTIANDPRVAAGMGIRAAHGEAVSMKLKLGLRYQLLLRASDGLTIHPLPGARLQQPSA